MKKIRFAVCGLGHIGRRHANIALGHEGAEVVAVIDPNVATESHELYPAGAHFYTNLNDFLSSDVEADVLTVATPNGFHVPLAMQALDAGMHVVIEKPMGLNRLDCERVLFKALNVNKQVFVVKQNRYSPPSKWLKEVVEQKIIGDTLMVQVNCYWNRDERYYGGNDNQVNINAATSEYNEQQLFELMEQRKNAGLHAWKGAGPLDGGVLYTQFSHFIDIMFWVFGDIKNIQTQIKNFNHQHNTDFEDSGNSIFEFVNGGLGVINFSTSVWDTNMESSITVVGTKGSLKIGGQYMNEIEYCNIKDYILPELPPTNPPNDYGPFKGSAANHHYVIENVVNTLNGNGRITANALEGMKVVDIIERIYSAARL